MYISITRYGLVVRVLGYGVSVLLNSPVLFSERNGYRKKLRIGPIAIEVLKP